MEGVLVIGYKNIGKRKVHSVIAILLNNIEQFLIYAVMRCHLYVVDPVNFDISYITSPRRIDMR